jgi:hypothetical protein
MFKSIITLTIALSVATPAMSARRSNNLADYPFPSESQRAEIAAAQSPNASSNTPANFRCGPSPEQVASAQVYSRTAFRQCQKDNLKVENQRALAEGVGNIVGILAEKALNRRSYGFRNSSRHYNNDRDSSQSCQDVADRAYDDMLKAVPASFCERSMTTRRTRGGQPLEPEVATENCQSTSNDKWDRAFRPTN